MLAYLAARAIPGVEEVSDGTLRAHASRSAATAASSAVDAGATKIVSTSPSAFPEIGALPPIIARVRRVFDLAADPDAIGAHLALDPVLAPLVAARPGLRVPGAWDGFELAMRAILGQQITVPAATHSPASWSRPMASRCPRRCGMARASAIVFPSPARIAGADLAGLGMPRAVRWR